MVSPQGPITSDGRPAMKLAPSLGILFAILLPASFGVGQDDKEPMHRGKPLSAWLKLLKSLHANLRVNALEAIHDIGPSPRLKAQWPALIKALIEGLK